MPLSRNKLKHTIEIGGEKLFINLSFDINDFIGDGVFWLQVFNRNKELLIDVPLASSQGLKKNWLNQARKIIKNYECPHFDYK